MTGVEVVVGRLGKPHGLRGDVTVEVRTDEPERRFAPGTVLRVDGPDTSSRTLTVAASRWHGQILLASFVEAPHRTAAEDLRGLVLVTDLDEGETPEDPDEFYAHELVGLSVRDLRGAELGQVLRLVTGGAQDLLLVRVSNGREVLVPFVKALVPEVDTVAGCVTVADRPGLIAPAEDD